MFVSKGVASVIGIAGSETYARATANWRGEAVGQDIANLLAYILLGIGIVAAVLALRARGEPAALSVAIGVSVLTIIEALALARFLRVGPSSL